MRWVDLTRPVAPGVPVFPGDPEFSERRIRGEGFRITELSLGTHTGTHVDAPAHVDDDGPTLDELPLELFAGTARVLDVRGRRAISPDDVRPGAGSRIVLLHTGWDEFAGTDREFDHPFLTPEAAGSLRDRGTRTVGIDTASVDVPGSLAAHRILLGDRDDPGVLVENLRGLAGLPATVEFFAFGWALTGGDGSPVRAVAR